MSFRRRAVLPPPPKPSYDFMFDGLERVQALGERGRAVPLVARRSSAAGAEHWALVAGPWHADLAQVAASAELLRECSPLHSMHFDYAGFGDAKAHTPSERACVADLAAAHRHLTVTRGVPPNRIILIGVGIGALIAIEFVHLASKPVGVQRATLNGETLSGPLCAALILHDPPLSMPKSRAAALLAATEVSPFVNASRHATTIGVPTLVGVAGGSPNATAIAAAARKLRVLWRLVVASDCPDGDALWDDDDYLGAVRALVGVMRGAVDDQDRASPLVAALARRPSRFQSPTERIERWLKALGLESHAVSFVANGYDSMEVIRTMTADELESIGIANEADRIVILDNIAEQKRQEAAGIDAPEDDDDRVLQDEDDDDLSQQTTSSEVLAADESFADLLADVSLVSAGPSQAPHRGSESAPTSMPSSPRRRKSGLAQSTHVPQAAPRTLESGDPSMRRSSPMLLGGGGGGGGGGVLNAGIEQSRRLSSSLMRFGRSSRSNTFGSMEVASDGVAIDQAAWATDSEQSTCACCSSSFTMLKRKHHCRACGNMVCYSCSKHTMLLATTRDVVSTTSSPANSLHNSFRSERYASPGAESSTDSFLNEMELANQRARSSPRTRPHSMSLSTPVTPKMTRHLRANSSSGSVAAALVGSAKRTRRRRRMPESSMMRRRSSTSSSAADEESLARRRSPSPGRGDAAASDDGEGDEGEGEGEGEEGGGEGEGEDEDAGSADDEDDDENITIEMVDYGESTPSSSRGASLAFEWSTVGGTRSRACDRCQASKARLAMLPEAQQSAIRALSAPALSPDAPMRHSLASSVGAASIGLAAGAMAAANNSNAVLVSTEASNGGLSALLLSESRRHPCTLRALANGAALLLEVVDISRTEPRRYRLPVDELRGVRSTQAGLTLECSGEREFALQTHSPNDRSTVEEWVRALGFVVRAVKK